MTQTTMKIEQLTKVSYTKYFDSFQDLELWCRKMERDFKRRGFRTFEVENNEVRSSKGRYECTCSAIRNNKDEQSSEGSAALPE